MKSSCVPAIRLLFCTFSNHSKNKVRNHQVRPHRFQWPLGFKRWSSAERWRDWRPTSETRIRPCLATAMLPGKHHLLMVSSGSYFSRTVVDSRGCTSGEKSRNFFWMTVPDYPSSFPASRFPASRAFPTMVPWWHPLTGTNFEVTGTTERGSCEVQDWWREAKKDEIYGVPLPLS